MRTKLFIIGTVASVLTTFPTIADNDVVSYIIKTDASSGIVSSRVDYTYDAEGHLTEELTSVNDPDVDAGVNDLIYYEKTNYSYDEQGRRNTIENYVWDPTLLMWYGRPSVDESKTVVNGFDDQDRPTEILYYSWSTSNWNTNYTYKGTFEYPSDNTGTETREKYINGIPTVGGSETIQYTYDSERRVIEKVKKYDRYVYAYDEYGNLTLEEWYGELGMTTKEKYEYTYNDKGEIVNAKSYIANGSEGEYMLVSDLMYEYHYNSNTALELPYSNDFNEADSLNDFTFTDDNGDGNTWKLDNGTLTCTSTQASEAPEIIYLPALRFNTDYEVEVSFKARVADASKPADIALILCLNDDAHTPLGTIGDIREINGTDYVDVKGYIVPEDNAPYVIAICFNNDNVGSNIIIDDLSVTEGRSTKTPMAPSYLVATPARDGSLQAEIRYTPALYTIGNEYVGSVDKTEIYRDGVEEPIYTTGKIFTALEQVYIDKVPAAGEYTYRVYSYINNMRSDAAMVTVKVGYRVPQSITGLTVVENDDHSVTISWDAPEAEDGNVKYIIERNNEEILATAHEGTSFTDNTIDTSNGQKPCFYYITPYNDIDLGSGTTTPLLFVGESHNLPFKESFPGGYNYYQWMNEIVAGTQAAWGTGSSSGEATPQDNDGGLAAFLSTRINEGNVVRFTSEKVDLSNAIEPELTFYVYRFVGDATGDAIVVEASTDNGEYNIISDPISAAGPIESNGWQQYTVSLDQFIGEKNVRISFRGIAGGTYDVAIDNIVISDAKAGIHNQLAAGTLVYAENGELVVSATTESDINVYSINGTTMYAGTTQSLRLPLDNGVYIVTIDGAATKVIVK